MDFTVSVCKLLNLNVFDVLKEDRDYVILLINYYIEKGQNEEEAPVTPSSKYDGFWDF